MIGSVGQGDSTPKITLSEFSTSKELMEKELDARVKSKYLLRVGTGVSSKYTSILFWVLDALLPP